MKSRLRLRTTSLLALLMMILAGGLCASAAEIVITGNVKDSQSEPVIGASVLV